MAKTHDAVVNQKAIIKPSEDLTIVLPATPAIGDWVTLISIEDDLTPITIDPNGIPLLGATTPFDFVWPGPGANLTLLYSSTSNVWFVEQYNEPDHPFVDLDISSWNPGSLGAGWADAVWTIELSKYFVFTPPHDVTFLIPGVYFYTMDGVFEHDSSNQGRTTNFRIWNQTTGTQIGTTTLIGTGRNAEATPFGVSGMIQITEAMLGDLTRVQFGGGDTYASVDFNSGGLTLLGEDMDLVQQATGQGGR